MKQQSNPSTEGLNSDKPRWDNWHVRLPNPKDQQKIIDLFRRSGAKTKSDFVRARLLGEEFKVISVDKTAVEYNRKLSEFTAQLHKIGILYNQAVRALNTYHSVILLSDKSFAAANLSFLPPLNRLIHLTSSKVPLFLFFASVF